MVGDHQQRAVQLGFPVVHSDEPLDTAFKRCFLIQLTQAALFGLFAGFEETAGKGPLIECRFMSTSDDQQLVVAVHRQRDGYRQRIDIVDPAASGTGHPVAAVYEGLVERRGTMRAI